MHEFTRIILIDSQNINAEEFIAAITQHIPEKSFQMVRYYGWYSNRSRGERRKEESQAADLDPTTAPEEIEALDVSTYKPRRIPSKTWRDCIRKVWEVDPLECPQDFAFFYRKFIISPFIFRLTLI